MDQELYLIVNVAVAVVIALAGGLVAHRLGQPAIVGYLLAGVSIGRFTPGFTGDQGQIAALAEVGVIFLMFALGIEFSFRDLAQMRGVALVGTSLQVALTMAAGAGLGLLAGWPLTQSIFFGGVIAISSTMVILKTLIDRGEVGSHHGRVLLSMLIVQDLLVVLLIILLPHLGADTETAVDLLVLTVVKAAVFVGGTLVLGLRAVPRLMAHVERLGSSELFLLTAAALALGSATISALLGLSPALGAFLAGLLLSETEFDNRVIAEIIPMRNLFATLFFVSVGMLIDPWFILSNLPLVLGVAAAIMVIKALATLVAVLPFRLGRTAVVFTSLGMVQIGEFSYVLAEAGVSTGAISEEIHRLVLTSSLITIITTPSVFWLSPQADRLLGRLPVLNRLLRHDAGGLPEGDEAPRDHAIVIGLGRIGRRVLAGLQAAGLQLVVIERDYELAQEIRDTGTPVIYGNAAYQEILTAAGIATARLVVVALPDAGEARAAVASARQANPEVPILARVAREEYDESVRRAGATAIIAPERAGARMLLEECARVLGLDPAQAMDAVTAGDSAGEGQRRDIVKAPVPR